MNVKGCFECVGLLLIDFCMDFIECVVCVGCCCILLLCKEFSLFELLWKCFFEVVMCEEMFNYFYQKLECLIEQVIDVFIFKVCQKLSVVGVVDVCIYIGKGIGWWFEMVDDIVLVEVNELVEVIFLIE